MPENIKKGSILKENNLDDDQQQENYLMQIRGNYFYLLNFNMYEIII